VPRARARDANINGRITRPFHYLLISSPMRPISALNALRKRENTQGFQIIQIKSSALSQHDGRRSTTRGDIGNAPAESPPGGCPVHSAAESGLRTLGIRSRKGDFRFGERDRRGADKRGARNGEYVKRDRWFESVSLQRRVNKLSVPQRQPGSVGRLAAAAVFWPDWLQPSRRICAIATPGPDVGEK